MQRNKLLLVALGLVASAIFAVTAYHWDTIWSRFYLAFFKRQVHSVTVALPRCDRVEVFHLGGISPVQGDAFNPNPEGFPVRGYGNTRSPIKGSLTLRGADAESLAAAWRAQTFGWEYSVLCHGPVYGFRFYSGSKLLFETSLCFHCSNFYVTALGNSGWWGFDSEAPKAQELLHRLQELFPASAKDA